MAKKLAEELKFLKEYTQNLIENANVIIMTASPEGKLTYFNRKAEELFGYSRDEVLGKSYKILHPKEKLDQVEHYFNEIAKGKDVVDAEIPCITKQGRELIISMNSTSVRDNGKTTLIAIAHDITDRKKMQEQLELERNKLQSIIDAMEYGLTIQDLDYNIIYQNEVLRNIFGSLGEKCYRVYEGKDKVCDGCPVEMAFKDGKSHTSERKVVMPSGEIAFWENTANPIRDASGKIVSCLEIARNITECKRMEEVLKESEEKYRRIWETSKDVLYLTSREGRFIDINQAGVDLFGYNKEELLKIDLARHLYVNPKDRKRFQEIIEKHGFVKDYEVEWKKKDKTKIYVSITANVRRDRNGNALGYEGIIRDITGRKKAEEEIKRLYEEAKALAERDPLTGLFNHRRINELLENEIERAKRGPEIFSIMMLDVDDLKLINDTYGHIAGDKILKDVATILKNSSRSVDSVGRYGGDEFLIILPYTDGEKAKTIAQRISGKIQQEGLKINGEATIPIRLSIGVATYPFDSSLPQDLISLADRNMYESKRSGRSVVSARVEEVSEFLTKERTSPDVLQGMVAAVNSKDYYTKSHSDLVTNYALSLGKKAKLPSKQMEALKIASLLHDIGKIGIPDTILRKPGPLKREEFEIIKQHPRLGAMMLDGPPPHREHVLGAIMYHHERYDGKGYPGKLKGEDIPLLARIIGIADAYSAMITDRPYRKALTKDEAIAELRKKAGTQFDPDLVSKFIECLK